MRLRSPFLEVRAVKRRETAPETTIAFAGCSGPPDLAQRISTWFKLGGRFVCGVNTGPVIGGIATNNSIQCFSLLNKGSSGVGVNLGPGGNNLFSPSNTLRSFALERPSNGGHGPFTLWALRADGLLYSNYLANPAAPTWGGWTFRGSSGTAIRMITSVQPPFGGPSLFGVGTTGTLHVFGNGSWSVVSGAGPFRLLFGDHYLGVALNGTSAIGTVLSVFPAVPGSGVPPSLALPSGHVLLNSTLASPYMYFGSQTQPISMGDRDIWALTRFNNFTYLRRSMWTNGTWGAWLPQDPVFFLPGGNASIQSVVDGFQARGTRGSLFFVGGTARLIEWVP